MSMVYSPRAKLVSTGSINRNNYLGGNKKAGIVTIGSYPNIRNQAVFWRTPQRTPSILQMTLLTTRRPTQQIGYRAVHGFNLG
jgi:hypothetical protein